MPIIPKDSDFAVSNPLTSNVRLTARNQRKPSESTYHYWLYALLLEDNNFYIGITIKANPYDRIRRHVDAKGALWTRMHRPVDVLEIRDIGSLTKAQAKEVELQLTLAYMRIAGYKKVRGAQISTTQKVHYIFSHFFWGRLYIKLLLSGILMLAAILGMIYALAIRLH